MSKHEIHEHDLAVQQASDKFGRRRKSRVSEGKRFGRLKAISIVGRTKSRNALWLCICDCGKEKVVVDNALGRSTYSCGCLNVQKNQFKHGHLCGLKHGHSCHGKSPTLISWNSMLQRCTNQNHKLFENYGGATPPVMVCKRWLTFENFLADMGERPAGTTLSRLLDTGNYEPGNVVWGTRLHQRQQARLKHGLSVSGPEDVQNDIVGIKKLKAAGVTQREIATRFGVSESFLSTALKNYGGDLAEAA